MNAPADKPVDFEALVLELRRNGWSYRAIAIEVGVAPSTVVDYANRGARPKYDEGLKLVRLWQGVTRSTDAQIPRVAALAVR